MDTFTRVAYADDPLEARAMELHLLEDQYGWNHQDNGGRDEKWYHDGNY